MKFRPILLTIALFAIFAQNDIMAADKKSAVAAIVDKKTPAAINIKEVKTDRLDKVLGDFEQYAVKAMADWRVPGMAIAIVRGDEVIYQKAFGVRSLGKDDPVTLDTVFQIGSTSKAFTSTLVAALVDEGKLKWDDKVLSHLSGFKMYDPWVTREFTVTDLMAQRSGMPPHAIDSLVMTGFGRDRVVDSLQYVKPATSFRSAYAYQNNLWLVAAGLVEKLTGDTWEENIRRRIFAPLGMSSSSTDMKSFVRGEDVAALHRDEEGKITALPMDWPYMDWTYVYGPAGGINSNIKDMAKWLRLQARNGIFKDKRLVKEESARFMHEPKTPIAGSTGPDQYYCLGWVHREASPAPITWHNGGTSGSKTMIAFVPPRPSRPAVGIVVLSNLVETQLPESLAWRFFDNYFGNPNRDWSKEALEAAKTAALKEDPDQPKAPAVPEPALALERYAGYYKSDIYGSVAVEKDGTGLTMTVGPKKVRIGMRHWDGNKFMARWKYFTAEEDAGLVKFDVTKEGAVTGMVADLFNADGCGIFTKVPLSGESIEQKPGIAAPRDRLVIEGMDVRREKTPALKGAACRFDKLFNEAVSVNGVKPVTYDQLQSLRQANERFVLVDVLSSDDYGTGHIPGAVSFPLKSISAYSAVNKIPMGSNVIVYCLDFRCPYSDDAARRLSGYGYRVMAYKGGLDEWQQKGQKLAR